MLLNYLFFAEPYDAVPVRTLLADIGFPDGARAERLLHSLAKLPTDNLALAAILEELVEELSRSADVARALLNLTNLCDAAPTYFGSRAAFFEKLAAYPEGRRRLARLLGWSQALADFVVRSPQLVYLVLEGGHPLSRPALRRLARMALLAGETPREKLDALRRFRQAQTLRIGLLDLDRDTWRNGQDFSLVVSQISDLAQVCIETVLDVVSQGHTEGFCVIIMGKGGARELNYSSDIDLIFLAENRPDAAELGQKLLRELGEVTAAGQLYRVDMRLRPDGGSGALVTPFAYALGYYESYAAAWEWQALIKARVVAGDAALGRRFRKFTRSISWAKRADDTHLREVFEMKKRSEATPEGMDSENVKQGPGGVRDAEWVVQQMQMMVGPSQPRARAAAMLRALRALAEREALSLDEERGLRQGYLWLRVVEHRLQLLNEQAVRTLPKAEAERAALARRLGCAWRGAAAARWLEEEHDRHRADIRAFCEKIFWAFAHEEEQSMETVLPPALQDAQSRARLDRLAHGTRNHPLPAPLSRQIRAALPGALFGLDRAVHSERAFVNFENLCDASGNRLSLLRALAATPRLSQALFTILGGAQSLADTLIRFPQLLDLTANRALLSRSRTWEDARADCRAYCLTFRDRKAALRRWRGREFLRIGLRDLLMDASPHDICHEIAILAGACLDLAVGEVRDTLRPDSQRVAFAALALGKFGGLEMHYASDCDVMFAYDVEPASGELAPLGVRWAEELIAFMGDRTEDGPGFSLDPRLRPYGASGALASPIDAFREYYDNEKFGFAVWERQALTRARFAAGDAATGARVMARVRAAAFPIHWKPEWSDELRHIKHRVEQERAGKGALAGSAYDVKLGPGCLSDIEWTVQWLALKNGAEMETLQTANTRWQIEAARRATLLSEGEARTLEEAYTWLRRAELRLNILREGGSTAVKRGSPDFGFWAHAIFPAEPPEQACIRFEKEWSQHTVPTRRVFERVREAL